MNVDVHTAHRGPKQTVGEEGSVPGPAGLLPTADGLGEQSCFEALTIRAAPPPLAV